MSTYTNEELLEGLELSVKNYNCNSTVFLSNNAMGTISSLHVDHFQFGNEGDSGDYKGETWNEAEEELRDFILNFAENVMDCFKGNIDIDNVDDVIDSILSAMQRN
jgi:hypothetical protein